MESERTSMRQPLIIAETPQYIIVEKPHGVPTVPLKKGSEIPTLLDIAGTQYPEILGDTHEGFTLHRLDTATRGLVLFARTAESYAVFQDLQKRGGILKEYLAICSTESEGSVTDGYPPVSHRPVPQQWDVITSRFRPWGRGRKAVRPVTSQSPASASLKAGRSDYRTEVFIHSEGEARVNCEVKIVNGFRHQIRSHLAWLGYPIIGDELYGGRESDVLHLYACGLAFFDRYMNRNVHYTLEIKDLDKE